jgi:acyl-coenzyme A thioesterase PaaI-like protein
LIDALVATQAPAEVLARAADALERAVEVFAGYGQALSNEGFMETANSGDPHAFFDRSPVIGRSNPLAPPVEVEIHDGRVIGRAVFGSAYEGPPMCVHGGYVAAAFDEVLGMTQSLSGAPGMTANLTVNYRKPTPLYQELRFEGELVRVEGRKIFTEGRVRRADGEITAEAEGLFISVNLAKFAALQRGEDT